MQSSSGVPSLVILSSAVLSAFQVTLVPILKVSFVKSIFQFLLKEHQESFLPVLFRFGVFLLINWFSWILVGEVSAIMQ